jgi:predicted transcriptional regulator YheO
VNALEIVVDRRRNDTVNRKENDEFEERKVVTNYKKMIDSDTREMRSSERAR